MGIGGAITGILVAVFGLGVMMIRVRLAVVFLGARTLLDMPFNDADAIKVGIVSLIGLVVILTGALVFIGSTTVLLIQYSRKKVS